MAAALVEVMAGEDVVQNDQTPQLFHGAAGKKCREPHQAARGGPGLLKFLQLRQVVPWGVTVAIKRKIHDDPPQIVWSDKTLQGQFPDIAEQQLAGALCAAPEHLVAQR